MMSSNSRPSSVVPNTDKISPQSYAASDTHSTGWIEVGQAEWVLAILAVGAVGSGGQVALTWLQATSSGGAGSKALTAGAFAEKDVTTANTVSMVEEHVAALDIANGFRYVKATLTVTTATCLASLTVHAGSPRYETGPSIST